MSRRFAGLAAALLITGALVALTPAVAAAAPVVDGNARFAVLTPTLIRMEYAGDGVFQDAATFTAVNRNLGAPAYTTRVTTDEIGRASCRERV